MREWQLDLKKKKKPVQFSLRHFVPKSVKIMHDIKLDR